MRKEEAGVVRVYVIDIYSCGTNYHQLSLIQQHIPILSEGEVSKQAAKHSST